MKFYKNKHVETRQDMTRQDQHSYEGLKGHEDNEKDRAKV